MRSDRKGLATFVGQSVLTNTAFELGLSRRLARKSWAAATKGMRFLCFARFSGFSWAAAVGTVAPLNDAVGQAVDVLNGHSAQHPPDQIEKMVEPVTNAVAGSIHFIVNLWQYLIQNTAAAIILSAVIGGSVALRSIASQHKLTRLRETFATLDSGVRDRDLITTRQIFRELLIELRTNNGTIAKYANPSSKKEIKIANALNTIMKDYENVAIGIRYNILDEDYLYRWMKTTVINDWKELSSLVTACRSLGSPNIYIEFEGMASAWHNGRSFRTGKKIKEHSREISVQ